MSDRTGRTIRIRHTFGTSQALAAAGNHLPMVEVTRGQNPRWNDEAKPYRHAACTLRVGPFALHAWINNANSRGAYYEWRRWGLSLPGSPIWKFERYP
jgi:hypothetical protein